jgi:hypothetical protein
VSISVGSLKPSVSISGAPAQMTAGTSLQLSATTANDQGGVEWESSAGALTDGDASGSTVTYTAPSHPAAGEAVVITARLRDNGGVTDERTVMIAPAPRPEPTPELPSEAPRPATQAPTAGAGAPGPRGPAIGGPGNHVSPALSKPRAMLVGRTLVMRTAPTVAGRVSLSAYTGRSRLGGCASYSPVGRDFTCRIRLNPHVSARAPISLRATLRAGGIVVSAVRRAERVPEMRMQPVGAHARIASAAGIFWCSPSTLTGVLAGVSKR